MRVLIFIFLIAAVAAGIFGASRWEEQNFSAPGPQQADKTAVIEHGSSLRAVASVLQNAGIIGNGLLFRVGVMRRGKSSALQAGEYLFPAHVSMAQVTDMLVRGDVLEHRLTIPEGLTSEAALTLINAEPAL